LTFRALNTGQAEITVNSSSQVLANDGSGTNILQNRHKGVITIVEPPAPPLAGPRVSSTSHPDSNRWYSNNTVEFAWEGEQGAQGYSYVFDQDSGTTPDDTVDTAELSLTQNDLGDGIWYLHIKTKFADEWSLVTHFRVQIDTGAPEDFLPIVEPPGVLTTPTPQIIFSTTDAISGIAYYEVKIDTGEFTKQESPYTSPPLQSGIHVISVKAVDNAGNITISKIQVEVLHIDAPTLKRMP
jgi:hypothetical protein